jgi:hypothetical protein
MAFHIQKRKLACRTLYLCMDPCRVNLIISNSVVNHRTFRRSAWIGTGTNVCVYITLNIMCLGWPPLWSSGQSSWLHTQKSGFDSRPYQIFWQVMGLERGPLSLVSTTEELLEGRSSGSGLETQEYCRRNPSLWPRGTLYSQELALISSTISGRSVGLARWRSQATELVIIIYT